MQMREAQSAEVKMIRVFVSTTVFDRQWAELELTDEDRRELENRLVENSEAGDVIQETDGLRKLRIPLNGKRGGGRVIYVEFCQFEKLYLFAVYGKNVKVDLSAEEKRGLNMMCKQIKAILKTAKLRKK